MTKQRSLILARVGAVRSFLWFGHFGGRDGAHVCVRVQTQSRRGVVAGGTRAVAVAGMTMLCELLCTPGGHRPWCEDQLLPVWEDALAPSRTGIPELQHSNKNLKDSNLTQPVWLSS